MQYVGAITHNVFHVDRSRFRRWSALRRGVIVMAILIGFSLIASPQLGSLAASMALFVGLQDRATDPPTFTVKIMALETAAITVVVAAAALTTGPALPAVLILLAAYAAGALAGRQPALSRLFADIVTMTAFLALTQSQGYLDLWAVPILLAAGLSQALFTWLAAPWQADLVERRPLATAMRRVADHLADATERSKSGTGQAAENALAEADRALRRSDLGRERSFELHELLLQTEALRQEASAIRAQTVFATDSPGGKGLTAAIDTSVAVLDAVATLLERTGASPRVRTQVQRQLREIAAERERAARMVADDSNSPLARSVAMEARDIAIHVERLVQARLQRTREVAPVFAGIRELFRPHRWDIKSGMRLAFAAVAGLAIAQLLDLTYGYWVAATAVALLRPAQSAVSAETIARALGTAAAVAVVVPAVVIANDRTTIALLFVALLTISVFMVVSANAGLYAMAMASWVVLTKSLAASGELSAQQVVLDRFLDTLIGCALVIVLVLLVPLGSPNSLRRELRDYAEAVSVWLSSLADVVGGRSTGAAAAARRAHHRLRDYRVPVQHHLHVLELDPLGPGIAKTDGQRMFTRIHSVERAAGAAATLMRDGTDHSRRGQRLAEQATADMHTAAKLLAGGIATNLSQLEPWQEDPDSPSGPLGDLLLVVARESREAAVTAAQLSSKYSLPA